MKIFMPKIYQKDIYQINYAKLKDLGYKILIFDLDNTLGSPKEIVCSKKNKEFLNKLQKDFQVIVASNSRKNRVLNFIDDIDCDFISLSLKPTLRSIRKIKKKYQIPYSKMVIIGDQVMTDIFMGNRVGLLTILVDPLKEDLKITALNRKIENMINKKNKIVRGSYYEKE